MTTFKKSVWTIILVVLMLTTTASAEILVHVDFITMDNIGQMATANYTPQNGYDYRFVNSAADISDGSDFAAVRDAFGTWIDLPSADLSVSEFSKSVFFTPGSRNGYNDISWVGDGFGYDDPWSDLLEFSDYAIATVMTWYSSSTGAVRERDLYFNDIDFGWRTDTAGLTSGGFYVEDIALHEIGHIYGLQDVYNPGQYGWQDWMGTGNDYLTMYGISSWQYEDTTLSDVDIAAITELFPMAIPEPKAAIMFMMAGGILFFTRKS